MAKNSTFVATLKFVDAFSPGLSQAIREAEKANHKLNNLGRVTSNLGGTLQRTGAVMTATITAPLVLLGKKAIDTASSYEGAINEIMTLQRKFATNQPELKLNTEEGFANFKAKVSDEVTYFAKQYGIAETEVAKSYYLLASAFNNTTNMQDAMNSAMKMSIVGGVEATNVADLLASAYNAYGEQGYDVAKVTDIMASTVMYGKTTFEELAGSLSQVIPTAAQAHMSMEDLATAMAVITSTGVNTSIATTYLKNALSKMLETGDRKAFSDDAFLQYLESLKATMPEIEQQMKTFKNMRARSGVTALIGGSSIELFKTYHNEMQKVTGTMDEMFDTVAGSKSYGMKKAMTTIDITLRRVGERLLPVVSNLFEKIADFLDNLDDKQLDLLVVGLTTVAAAGPLLTTVGTAMTVIGGAMNAVSVVKGVVSWLLKLNPANVGALESAATALSSGALTAGATTATTTATTAGVGATIATALENGAVLAEGALSSTVGQVVAPVVISKYIIDKTDEEIEKQKKNGTYHYETGVYSKRTGARVSNASEIQKVPANASGTSRWSGGLTTINERGGEIVDLPTGSRIYPHDQSMKMGGLTINIPKFADTITIRNENDIDMFAEAFANKLLKVVVNR